MYIPQMSHAGARLTAAALRSFGLDARPAPDSDSETLDLGGLYSSGEECLPHKVTLGDFLKVTRAPGFDPARTAFFMPTAEGPCRFGQYAPYLRKVLDDLGYEDALVVSPSSTDSYDGLRLQGPRVQICVWMALLLGDLLNRLRLKTRPYETHAGDTDAVFEEGIAVFAQTLELPGLEARRRLNRLAKGVERVRDRFRSIPAAYEKGRPLIGLVGEIFCRQHTFSNDEIARRIEKLGGECRLSDITEWVWYTNWSRESAIRRRNGRFNLDYAKARIKSRTQQYCERTLLASVARDFVGYEEPHDVREILDRSRPYLPAEGCLGEMVLSVGKAIYLAEKGAAGVIDISPFTCMNGVISEAVYPAVSAANGGIPIRVCYFDGVNAGIDQDLEIFLDLARAYQRTSSRHRRYPTLFGSG